LLKIAIDIDGVVSDTAKVMSDEAERRGYIMSHGVYKPEIIGIDDSYEIVRDIIQYIFLNRNMDIEPYKDAYNLINVVLNNSDCIFLTARATTYIRQTEWWINQKLHLQNSIPVVYRNSKDKITYLKEMGFDYLIDDRLRTCNEAASESIKVFMPIRQWNSGRYVNNKVKVVDGFDDIVSYLYGVGWI